MQYGENGGSNPHGFQGQGISSYGDNSQSSHPNHQNFNQRFGNNPNSMQTGEHSYNDQFADHGYNQLALQNQQLQQELLTNRQLLEQQNQKLTETDGFISKMRGVFNPEQHQSEPTVKDKYGQKIDQYLEAEIEAQKRGSGMPLTTSLAHDSYTHMMQQEDINQKLQSELESTRKQIEMMSNPSFQIDQNAYRSAEAHLNQQLDKLYGPIGQNDDIKDTMRTGISQGITRTVQQLQKERPEIWNQVRRDPMKLAKLVNHHVEKTLPPAVVQEQRMTDLQNSPMSRNEKMQALQEARQLPPSAQRDRIISEIRGSMLRDSMFGKRGDRSLSNAYAY